ncbi:MAG: hypothetical protein ABJF23_27205 [Bryobacteraceae bacterium]
MPDEPRKFLTNRAVNFLAPRRVRFPFGVAVNKKELTGHECGRAGRRNQGEGGIGQAVFEPPY